MKKNVRQSPKISDSTQFNWVDRFCPFWSKPFLKLSRFDRPIGTWLLLLPCWWGSSLAIWSTNRLPTIQDFWIIVGCVIGAILMRGAGCTWNDINDQKFDSKVARTRLRPIPSGQVTTKNALLWMLIQIILSFFILLTFNQFAIILGIISILPVAIYPFAKRFTWWPQFFLGICFNWGILLSFVAHNNTIETSIVLLYFAGVFWTLFYDTIYAFQDTEDDALIGLKSTALLFGDYAKYWLVFFASLIFILKNISFSQILSTHFISESIMRFGAFLFFVHLLSQLWRLRIGDSKLCLKIFQSNKRTGLLFVLFAIFAIISNQLYL